MAAPGEGPKPAPVEAKKPDVPKTPDAKAPDAKTPDQAAQKPAEKAAPTPEQVEAKKKGIREGTRSALDGLKGKLPQRADATLSEIEQETLFNKIKGMVNGPVGVPFSRKSPQDFLTKTFEKLDPKLATFPEKERQNAKAVFMDKLFGSFQKNVFDSYPEIFIDGADESIRVDVTIDNGEAKVLLNPADEPKRKLALQKIDDTATAQAKADLEAKGAQATTEATEQQKKDNVEKVKSEFQAKYPQGMSVVEALCGGDKEKVDAAFAGTGFLGFVLGLLGFGTGKGLWEMLSNNKTFAPYVKDIREKFDSMLGGVQEIDKPEAFEALYQGATPGLQKRIEKKFHTKVSFALPADMKVKAIQFKADAEVRIADGTLKKFEAGKSYENEEFKKGATFPPETSFADVTVTVPEKAPEKKEN